MTALGRVLAAGLAITITTIGGRAIAAGDRPAPGMYRITVAMAGETPHERQECLSADDLAEALTLSLDGGRCTTTRSVTGAGRIDIARTCTQGGRVTSGSVSGTYTARGYSVRVQSRGPALPQPIDLRLVATRTAACSAD